MMKTAMETFKKRHATNHLGTMRGHQGLMVWQRGMALVSECYRLAGFLPRDERFGLASQTRRAAVSVVANIAEGHGRAHRGSFLLHLSIARGSLKELETYLAIMKQQNLVRAESTDDAERLADEVSRMLTVLGRRLR